MNIIEKDCLKTLDTALLLLGVDNAEVVDVNNFKINKKELMYLFDIMLMYDKDKKSSMLHVSKEDTSEDLTPYSTGKTLNFGFGILKKSGDVKISYISESEGDSNLSPKKPGFWADYAVREKAQALVYLFPHEYAYLTNEKATFTHLKNSIMEAVNHDLGLIILPVPETDTDDKIITFSKCDEGIKLIVYSLSYNKEVETELSTEEEFGVVGKLVSGFQELLNKLPE